MNSCTCIIPFYNEGKSVLKVLNEVIKIKGINKIIGVDDGSTDNVSTLIRKRHPRITVIANPNNQGKTEAINQAIKQSKGAYVLLLDADLRNFNHSDIEKAVVAIQSNNDIDMIILRRVNAPFIVKLNRGDTLLSGERILKREDLQKLLEQERPKGYQIELAINQYMMTYNKNVYWMPSSALNTYPIYKRGFIKGLYKIISMQINILSYIGFTNFIKQELFFCKKRLASQSQNVNRSG